MPLQLHFHSRTRRSTVVSDYTGLSRGHCNDLRAPVTTDEITDTLKQPAQHHVTIRGAGRSFGAHAIPEGSGECTILATRALRNIWLQPRIPSEVAAGRLRVIVGAGVTFSELLRAVDTPEGRFFPFAAPTSDRITVAGALAAGAYSRTTAAGFGYLADHVLSFDLITPDLGTVHCRRDAPDGSLAQRLFQTTPGSYGALGLINNVEIVLREVPRDRRVYTCVLYHSSNPEDLEAQFNGLVCNVADPPWNEGVFAVVHGNPAEGQASIVGSRQVCRADVDPSVGELIVFADHPFINACIQGIGNRFPRLASWAMKRALVPGAQFVNDVESYSFFQTSHDKAHKILKYHPIGVVLHALGLVDPKLPTRSQTWEVPTNRLATFMRCAGTLLTSTYPDVLDSIELQDLLWLPRGDGLSTSHGAAHMYTIDFAHDRGGPRTERINAFLRALSAAAAAPAIGAKVLLLRDSVCDDALLREMHAAQLDELRYVKGITDSRGILSSEFLARLLPHDDSHPGD